MYFVSAFMLKKKILCASRIREGKFHFGTSSVPKRNPEHERRNQFFAISTVTPSESKANLLPCVAMKMRKTIRDHGDVNDLVRQNRQGQKGKKLTTSTEVVCGDCAKALQRFKNNTFDLIVTSPPYADQRSKTYGGIKPSEYVRWFLARSEQFRKVAVFSGH